jgi:hypothetical protein
MTAETLLSLIMRGMRLKHLPQGMTVRRKTHRASLDNTLSISWEMSFVVQQI